MKHSSRDSIDQWRSAKQIFQSAIQLPEDQRGDFVNSKCSDGNLKQQVLALIEGHFRDSDFLDSPMDIGVPDSMANHTIGRYQIIRQIGRGGMGTVFEARQENPARRVAIKMLRRDHLLPNDALRRFQNESKMLAKMQHPGIAHVYDSGTQEHDDGPQPWFAMELIDGETLSKYLLQNKLTVEEKLQLFRKICAAVEHAHQQGVIHRDLKPANILIQSDNTISDATIQARPKIVDFGISRMVASESSTLTQGILGTLDYLSPEYISQKSPNQLDHRSDIYALGVIAYEMLTGKLPHDRSTGSLEDTISRIATEEMPPLASSHSISSDLEVVVAKAMSVSPSRRYQSAQAFSDDIARYLAQQPVQAKRASLLYRLKKYTLRNRILLTGATTTIIALTVGIVAYATIAKKANASARSARYEADKAVAVNSFMTNDFLTQLLNQAGPSNDSRIPLRQLIKNSSDRIDTMFPNRPLVQAAIHNEVGTVYYNVGAFQDAAIEYQQALTKWESGLGPEHADTLKAVSNLAQTQMSLGANEETLQLCRRAYRGRKKTLGESNEATQRSLNNLADLLRRRKQFDEAEQLFLHALNVQKKHFGPTDKTGFTISANLGSLYLSQQRTEEALKLHQASHKNAQRIYGDTHTFTLQTGIRYVQTLDKSKRFQQAIDTLMPMIDTYEKQNNLLATVIPYRLLARIYRHQGEKQQAKTVLNQLLAKITDSQISTQNAQVAIKKIKRDLRRLEKK